MQIFFGDKIKLALEKKVYSNINEEEIRKFALRFFQHSSCSFSLRDRPLAPPIPEWKNFTFTRVLIGLQLKISCCVCACFQVHKDEEKDLSI